MSLVLLWAFAVLNLGFNVGPSVEQGFGAHYATNIMRTPQNNVGNCLGPYMRDLGPRGLQI